jgi:hypothetical protein
MLLSKLFVHHTADHKKFYNAAHYNAACELAHTMLEDEGSKMDIIREARAINKKEEERAKQLKEKADEAFVSQRSAVPKSESLMCVCVCVCVCAYVCTCVCV